MWTRAAALANQRDRLLNEGQRHGSFAAAYKACEAMRDGFVIPLEPGGGADAAASDQRAVGGDAMNRHHDRIWDCVRYLASLVAPFQTEDEQCDFLGLAYEAVSALVENAEIQIPEPSLN